VTVVLISTAASHEATSFIGGTRKVNISPKIPDNQRPPRTTMGAMNLLLLGIDTRNGLTQDEIRKYSLGSVGADGSDTMMLVHISAARDKVTVLSLPRDLLVDIPAWHRSDGQSLSQVRMKINAAFPRGGGLAMDGPALTVTTIEKLTGIHIDHYLSIDVPHLGRMVQALHGVEVCLPMAIKDPVRNHHGSGLVLSAGKHVLNDVEAVGYVRARYIDTGEGSSDFGRIRRQQKFLSSLINKVMSTGTLTNIGMLTDFLHTVSAAVTMDAEMTGDDLLSTAEQLQNLDPKHVTFVTVPFVNDSYSVPGVGLTVLPDATAAQALYERIINDEPIDATSGQKTTIKPENVTVQVLNSGGKTGSAAEAVAQLASNGFQTTGPGRNAVVRGAATTTIRYPGTEIDAARLLARYVKGAVLGQDDTAHGLVLTIGSDFSGVAAVQASQAIKPILTHSAADNICSTT
jgi:LCP family protein required for cell wall assembly